MKHKCTTLTTAILSLSAALLIPAVLPTAASPTRVHTGASDVGASAAAPLTSTVTATSTGPVSPTTTVTATSAVTMTATATASPTDTPTPTVTDTPTATATFTVTPSPTATPCPTQAPPSTAFSVDTQVGGSLLRGHTVPGGQVSATLGEPEAGTRATAQGSADATGAWVLQFLDAEGKRPIAIQPNWLVHVSAPNGSADIRPVKLSLIIDPAQTRVSGEGPPDSRLEIFSSFSSGAQVLHTNAQGRFSALWRADRMPGIDAWAEVFYEVAPNQKVFYRDRYASLVIELDSAIVRITAPPMSHVSASVEEADRRLLATVTGTANGWGEAMFGLVNQVTGKPLPIRPGLRVIATSSSEEYSHQIDPVPEMTGRIVPGGRSLIGRTESIAYNAVLTARLYWPPDPDSPCTATMVERRGTVDRQGNYVILFETGGAGALPQPLALLERLVLAYTRRTGEEAQRELSPEWNLPAAHLYMPIARKDLRPR